MKINLCITPQQVQEMKAAGLDILERAEEFRSKGMNLVLTENPDMTTMMVGSCRVRDWPSTMDTSGHSAPRPCIRCGDDCVITPQTEENLNAGAQGPMCFPCCGLRRKDDSDADADGELKLEDLRRYFRANIDWERFRTLALQSISDEENARFLREESAATGNNDIEHVKKFINLMKDLGVDVHDPQTRLTLLRTIALMVFADSVDFMTEHAFLGGLYRAFAYAEGLLGEIQ